MTRLFLECSIRAALIVIGTAIVLYAMRVKVAAVRHRVWTAVLLLMLALPAWTAWGPKAQLRLLPASVQRFASQPGASPVVARASATQATAETASIAETRQRLFSTSKEILLGVYLLGLLTLFVRLMIGTMKASRLIRDATLVDGFMTSSACAAPVTVGCLRPKVILPPHWREWSQRQLDVVLAHEGEHVHRRDPLVQWIALLNRAIFWFHPAAWWLERELSALAEEACDAAVIAQGHDPREYAETLMKIARDVMDSGSRINSIAIAMPGLRLPARIRTIVEATPSARVSRLRAFSVVASCTLICSAFLAVTLVGAQDTATRDWEKAAGGKMSFDVASVKLNSSGQFEPPNFPLDANDGDVPAGGLFRAPSFQVITFIQFAYKVQLTPNQVSAILAKQPPWFNADRWDIEARGPANTTKDQVRLMMQSLLADRFKLAVHLETRQEPVLALIVERPDKLGPLLIPHSQGPPCEAAATEDNDSSASAAFPSTCNVFAARLEQTSYIEIGSRNTTMDRLAATLGTLPEETSIDRAVIDKTSLTGRFDVLLKYTPDTSISLNGGAVTFDSSQPTLFSALKEQLGLRLERETGPVQTLIIDHAL